MSTYPSDRAYAAMRALDRAELNRIVAFASTVDLDAGDLETRATIEAFIVEAVARARGFLHRLDSPGDRSAT